MNDFTPDKPFKSYDEQVKLLVSRGLNISNKDLAIHALKTYSYYDLVNGNLDSLMLTRHPDRFMAGTSFEDLVQIRLIEDRLKNSFLKQILMIEKSFKTAVSYYVSSEFGVNSQDGGYLSISNYTNVDARRNIAKSTISKLKKVRDGNVNHPQGEPIKHYRRDHNHIPPWILVEELTFGETVYWFKSLKSLGQDFVINQLCFSSSEYEVGNFKDLFIQSLDIIREFRNFFAHNSVLSHMQSRRELDIVLLQRECSSPLIKTNEFIPNNRHNLFACFLSMLLLSNDMDQTSIFLAELQQTLNLIAPDRRDFFSQKIFNLPIDFLDRGRSLVKETHPKWPIKYFD